MNTKSWIDINLKSLQVDLDTALRNHGHMLNILETYYDSLEDDDFPHKQNVYRFIQKYKTVFTERTLSLADEVEALRKDWQLKAGVLNKTKGVWEYE